MAVAILNRKKWIVRVVEVTAAGTPVQGPSVVVPNGFAVGVTQRHHSGSSPIGYVAISSAAALVTTTRRELRDGGGFTVFVTNFNLFWFDSDTNSTFFELLAEQ